ncbi:MAG: class I SAM-dependent methyltransferase [Candidatus Margulisiibacteriota bacterium]
MFKARMYNKKAASKKSKPEEILKVLNQKPGQKIADIGSGGGYFTLRFAEAIGDQGKVCAIDTKEKYRKKFKANGRLAVIEYKSGGNIFNFKRFFGHNVPKEKIITELGQAGYQKIEEYGFLPEQSFCLFSPA